MSANKYPMKHYIGVEAAKARIGLQVENEHAEYGKFTGLGLNNHPIMVLHGQTYYVHWVRFMDNTFYDPRHARPLNWLIEVLTPELRKKPEPKEGEVV